RAGHGVGAERARDRCQARPRERRAHAARRRAHRRARRAGFAPKLERCRVVTRVETREAHMRIQGGERLTRRAFLGTTAGATGAILGSSLLQPAAALAAPRTDSTPNPSAHKEDIFGVTFSLTFPGPGTDLSSITDFKGFMGFSDVRGTGTATYANGSTETLLYDTDMRFMTGTYVAKDGHVYNGTFGFV